MLSLTAALTRLDFGAELGLSMDHEAEGMCPDTTKEMHKSRALELANLGTRSTVAADHAAARHAWQEAFDYAEKHLAGDNITYWIRDGLGAALLQVGDYHRALAMAGSALEWCGTQRAPSASLTMAKSCLRLGDVTRARQYARQAYGLRGEGVLKVFSPTDREALGQVALASDAS